MYPLILVPLDGSSFAERALPAAVALASRHQAPLHLVAVHAMLARPLDMPGAPAYDSRLDEDRRKELEGYLSRTAARLTGELGREVTYSTVRDDGSTSGAIVAEAARRAAGLVVLSTHGRGGFSRVWLGSVTSELLRTLPVPMYVVRGTPEGEPAVELAAPFGAAFTVLRVVRTAESQLPYDQTFWTAAEEKLTEEMRVEAQREVDQVVSELGARGIAADGLVVLDSDAARTILRVAGERAVDLIAMSTRGRGGMSRLLVGSVTDKVVRGADQAVLVVRPAQE